MQILLMCRSLTYAQRSARVLERAGIAAGVTRAPRAVSTRGCGYCVTVPVRHGTRAAEVLTEAGLRPEKAFRREADGTVREVFL